MAKPKPKPEHISSLSDLIEKSAPELQGCYYTPMLIEALQDQIRQLQEKLADPDPRKEVQRLQKERIAQEARHLAVINLARQIIRELSREDQR